MNSRLDKYLVRNRASTGTVAGTRLIRTPSGERRATHTRDERKSHTDRMWAGTRHATTDPLRPLVIFSRDYGVVGEHPRTRPDTPEVITQPRRLVVLPTDGCARRSKRGTSNGSPAARRSALSCSDCQLHCALSHPLASHSSGTAAHRRNGAVVERPHRLVTRKKGGFHIRLRDEAAGCSRGFARY